VPPAPSKWTGSLKAGAIITRGNSETENFNINFDATRRTEKHRITTGAGYFFGQQRDPNTGDDNTTVDNWFALGKYDYFFTPKFYGYFQTRVEHDRIAHLDLRVIPGIGVGISGPIRRPSSSPPKRA
jgi:putative salt-induced outer membrane protein YdiY